MVNESDSVNGNPREEPFAEAATPKTAFMPEGKRMGRRRKLNFLVVTIATIVYVSVGICLLIFYLLRRQAFCRDSLSTQSSIQERLDIIESEVDPCQDFYTYSCGRWNLTTSKENKFTSLIEEIDSRNLHRLELYLKCTPSRKLNVWGRFVKKTFYSCQRDRQSPINRSRTVAFVKDFAAPLLKKDADPISLNAILQRVHHRSLQNGLFSWGLKLAWSSNYDRMVQALTIAPPKPPRKKGYLFDPRHHSAEYVKDVLILLGADEISIRSTSEKIIELNSLLNKVFPKILPKVFYKNRMTYGEFKSEFDFINFENYFGELSPPNSTLVVVEEVDYFNWLNDYAADMRKAGDRTIHDLLIWSAIDFFVPYMTKEFVQVRNRHALKLDPKAKEIFFERSHVCLDAIRKGMNFAVSSLFMDKLIEDNSLTAINEVMSDVKNSFKNFVVSLQRNLEGNERPLSNGLQEVFDAVQIGVPDHLRQIYREHNPLKPTQDSFPARYLFAVGFTKERMMSYLDVIPRGVMFLMDFLQPNGIFINKPLLMIHAGALTPPFFDLNQLPCLNYAGLGFVLAHELAHSIAFLAHNASSMKNHLKSKLECLHQQYPDSNRGRDVDDEDFADNIAIRVAYDAYLRNFSRSTEKNFFDDRKMFFTHFSQIWCEDGSSFNIENNVFHSPYKYRVNTPLSNFPTFSEVFACPKNSAMNRGNRCSI